jgi:hypothetical protein
MRHTYPTLAPKYKATFPDALTVQYVSKLERHSKDPNLNNVDNGVGSLLTVWTAGPIRKSYPLYAAVPIQPLTVVAHYAS